MNVMYLLYDSHVHNTHAGKPHGEGVLVRSNNGSPITMKGTFVEGDLSQGEYSSTVKSVPNGPNGPKEFIVMYKGPQVNGTPNTKGSTAIQQVCYRYISIDLEHAICVAFVYERCNSAQAL